MSETPSEYVDRIMNHVLKAKKDLSIHDSTFEPISKAEQPAEPERQDPIDLVLKKYGITVEKASAPQPTPKTIDEQIDELLKKYSK